MLITIENQDALVRIDTLGAQLYQYQKKADGYEVLWNGDPAWWTGRSPVLFPVIGVLLDGTYRYQGKEYSMPKHGFARRKEFALTQQTASSAEFSLKADEETRACYPFEFELTIQFELCENSLEICYSGSNLDDKTMYCSLGAHPAFHCTLGDTLEFEQKERLERIYMDEKGLLTGESAPLLDGEKSIEIKQDTFAQDALMVTGFQSKSVALVRENYKVTVSYGNAPYLGLWAKPGAPYVCIEPWYGINDSYQRAEDISEKPGIQSLSAGKRFDFRFSILAEKRG